MPNTLQKQTNLLPILKTKSQLHEIITNDNGSPDYLAINIYYDTLRSWYTPNKIKDLDGNIITIKKLKTKGIYFSYKKLSELHGCSTETIRRKIVKLEKLGLIQRGFKHKETVTTKSYNQLIIYIWRYTPHFFNKHGIDKTEIGELKPQTNHEYIAEKYNIDYNSQVKQIKAVKNKEGIHTNVDTKELIEPFNKLKDRSNKHNLDSRRINTDSHEKRKSFINRSINGVENNSAAVNDILINNANLQKDVILSNDLKNGFLGSGKYLPEILDHLTDEICRVIRSRCGKNYTNRAIREIAKTVSKSKKGSRAFFYHIKGFIAYLSEVVSYEKKDPLKTGSINYYIGTSQTSKEKITREQERYLTDIEYSLQVSREWHLKKKLAATLERSKAYNILTSYKSLNIKKNKAVVQLNRRIELSRIDKDIILQQIQATHEKMDNDGNYQRIEFLELITPGKSVLSTITKACILEENFPKREGIWGKIRETFSKSFASGGDNLDKAWLSRLSAKIDENKKTIELQAPNDFIKDFIEERFMFHLMKSIKSVGFELHAFKS